MRKLALILVTASLVSSCVARDADPPPIPEDSVLHQAWQFPPLTDEEFEAMRLVAQEWHHATRERRGVRANAPRLNYVSLFYVDIEFDGSSLHREPSLVWIWGVHADGSSMARIRFDDTGPVVVDEIDPDTRMSISLDEARVSFRRAIETASGRLPGDPAVVRFRLGWTGTGAYRIQETIYPSNDDVIAWTVETADGRAIQFDANTFQPVSR